MKSFKNIWLSVNYVLAVAAFFSPIWVLLFPPEERNYIIPVILLYIVAFISISLHSIIYRDKDEWKNMSKKKEEFE